MERKSWKTGKKGKFNEVSREKLNINEISNMACVLKKQNYVWIISHILISK